MLSFLHHSTASLDAVTLNAPRNSGLFLAVKEGSLLAMPIPSGSPEGIAKTFGTQLWEAEFSSLNFEGLLNVEYRVRNLQRHACISTAPFEIRSRLVTSRMMKPLSILNAEPRRAADEDFWRNWIRESGDWSVALEDAFLVDRECPPRRSSKLRTNVPHIFAGGDVRLGRIVFDARESVV